jgi:putative membrane protein
VRSSYICFIFFFRDLYHCVKFLYPYTLPAGLPTSMERNCPSTSEIPRGSTSNQKSPVELPQPVTASRGRTSQSTISEEERLSHPWKDPAIETREQYSGDVRMRKKRFILPRNEEKLLFPASMPPKYSLFDFFPFSLMTKYFAKRGQFKGRRAARLRAKLQSSVVSHNIPLEISLYLVGVIHSCVCRVLTIESNRVHILPLCNTGAWVMLGLSVSGVGI